MSTCITIQTGETLSQIRSTSNLDLSSALSGTLRPGTGPQGSYGLALFSLHFVLCLLDEIGDRCITILLIDTTSEKVWEDDLGLPHYENGLD